MKEKGKKAEKGKKGKKGKTEKESNNTDSGVVIVGSTTFSNPSNFSTSEILPIPGKGKGKGKEVHISQF